MSVFCLTLVSCMGEIPRQITVEGTHEEEITPDKVILGLELSEYWREELIPGLAWNDYRNRGPSLDDIEKDTRKILSDAGMPPEAMTIVDSGTKYRNSSGRDLLFYRRYNISLSNLSLIQPLLSSLKGPGVGYFRLEQLTHTDIEGLKNKSTKQALDNAYAKAKAIVTGHAEIGPVLNVQEGNIQLNLPVVSTLLRSAPAPAATATPMALDYQATPANEPSTDEQIAYNKIKIVSSVQATFKLK